MQSKTPHHEEMVKKNTGILKKFQLKSTLLGTDFLLLQSKFSLLEQIPKTIHYVLLRSWPAHVQSELLQRLRDLKGEELKKLLHCDDEEKRKMEELKEVVASLEAVVGECRELRHPWKEGDTDPVIRLNDISAKLRLHSGLEEIIRYPRICMVGEQSAGKSSLVARLVTMDIAVVGDERQTRCPITYQLFPIRDGDEEQEPYVTVESRRFRVDQLPAVRDEIKRVSAEHCRGDEFSSTPINVEVHSRDIVAPLTLVDLPGLQVQGDHKERVQSLVRTEIEKDESIILAVSTGKELVTNLAMGFVEDVDSKKERTISVLTKLDVSLSSPQFLQPNVIKPLQDSGAGLPIFGTACSSNMLSMTKAEADEAEMRLLSDSRLDSVRKQLGVPVLFGAMRTRLLKSIEQYSEEMLRAAEKLLTEKRTELAKMMGEEAGLERHFASVGVGCGETRSGDEIHMLSDDVRCFVDRLKIRLNGTVTPDETEADIGSATYGSVQIHHLLREELPGLIDDKGLEEDSEEKIAHTHDNLRSHSRPVGDAREEIRVLAKLKIEELKPLLVEYGRKAVEVLEGEARTIVNDRRFSSYPNKKMFFLDEYKKLLEPRTKVLRDLIMGHVEAEAYTLDASSPALQLLTQFLDQAKHLAYGEQSAVKGSTHGIRALREALESSEGLSSGFLASLAVDVVGEILTDCVSKAGKGDQLWRELHHIVHLLSRADLPQSRGRVLYRFVRMIDFNDSALTEEREKGTKEKEGREEKADQDDSDDEPPALE